MNCEKCQELIGDLVDGSLSREDAATLNQHLEDCLVLRRCAQRSPVDRELLSAAARTVQCSAKRGALWLRIRNVIEAENTTLASCYRPAPQPGIFPAWLSRSWELSVPQLAAAVAALVVVVSLATAVGIRRMESSGAGNREQRYAGEVLPLPEATFAIDISQQQQAINYWNQRVELNKARWNQQMRETFDRNLQVIDQAVNDSLNEVEPKSP